MTPACAARHLHSLQQRRLQWGCAVARVHTVVETSTTLDAAAPMPDGACCIAARRTPVRVRARGYSAAAHRRVAREGHCGCRVDVVARGACGLALCPHARLLGALKPRNPHNVPATLHAPYHRGGCRGAAPVAMPAASAEPSHHANDHARRVSPCVPNSGATRSDGTAGGALAECR
eukprot:NODE_23113_length_680_cov_2.097649.p1 GENE.NODE_23113_length_680_cov_2.097649~~NODE_23113_length_680_cov_2.097649.p1  ORF type:complete len:200 (+),score=34.96 NODE_23113_length_680_cov_2.097649:73-600(+)